MCSWDSPPFLLFVTVFKSAPHGCDVPDKLVSQAHCVQNVEKSKITSNEVSMHTVRNQKAPQKRDTSHLKMKNYSSISSRRATQEHRPSVPRCVGNCAPRNAHHPLKDFLHDLLRTEVELLPNAFGNALLAKVTSRISFATCCSNFDSLLVDAFGTALLEKALGPLKDLFPDLPPVRITAIHDL